MATQAAHRVLLLAALLLVAGSGPLAPCLAARQLAQQQTLGPISNAASDASIATQAAGATAPPLPGSQPVNDTTAQPAGGGEAPWQQRRTLQLPPHVYLISFVMLLAIMAALLSCHCYRMCRIARRMRQAAELGVTVTSAGATLSKRTPQSVIESLPVSKYSSIHSQRSAKAAPQPGCGSHATSNAPGSVASAVPAGEVCAAAADDCGAASGAAAAARLGPFVAAAMQLREQIARQTGVASLSFGGSSSTAAAGDPPPAAAATAGTSATHTSCGGDSAAQAAAAASAPTPAAAALARLQSSGFSSSSSGGEPCAICFEEFRPEDLVKELPCRHFYHAACIDEWLVRDVTCPLCKAPVLDKELLEEQQRLAAALESSFGNVSFALRRQQALLRSRRQQQQQQQSADGAASSSEQLQGATSPVPGGGAAAASTAPSAAAAGPAEAGDSTAGRAGGRRRSQGTMLELLDLAAQVMLSFPGAPASRVNNNATPLRLPAATSAQQQQQQQGPASNSGARAEPAASGDVELGQRVAQ